MTDQHPTAEPFLPPRSNLEMLERAAEICAGRRGAPETLEARTRVRSGVRAVKPDATSQWIRLGPDKRSLGIRRYSVGVGLIATRVAPFLQWHAG